MVRAVSIAIKLLLVGLPIGCGAVWLLWASLNTGSGTLLTGVATILSDYNSMSVTLGVAVIAPLLACYLALWMAPVLLKSGKLQQLLSPLLSVPHVAFAVGLMLLMSPSGWLIRAFEAITGLFPVPPQGWLLPQKSTLTVVVVLVLKELPFLLLMISAQLKQLPSQRWMIQAQSYGYSDRQAWWRVVTPELLTRLTLPMAAVIIYSLSVVDIPLLVGSNPSALLAQRVFEWRFQFSAESQASALAGAGLLVVLALALLALNTQHANLYKQWIAVKGMTSRQRPQSTEKISRYAWGTLAVLAAGVIGVLILQSLASSWFYPGLWPESVGLSRWQNEWAYLAEPTRNSLWLAAASAAIGLVCAVALLQRQRQRQEDTLDWPILLALFVPQVPLVLGWQLALGNTLSAGWQGMWVLWSHTVYTLPYAYLVLHGAYMGYDEQWLIKAQSHGYTTRQAWWRVMLPMLKQPLAVAFAVAFSVSIAQYVPTQWLGQGGSSTLTTEAVSVASGGDWRIGSLYALLQMILPLIVFIAVGLLMRKSHAEHS